jgi:(R,R)-butanediol dehydrogenase / meso-butanediol dehydrogenase / diacetyl reductase
LKAAVFHGQRDVKVDQVKAPEVQAGSLKVKADWCRRCRTDRHEYLAGPIFVPAPGEPHPLMGDDKDPRPVFGVTRPEQTRAASML